MLDDTCPELVGRSLEPEGDVRPFYCSLSSLVSFREDRASYQELSVGNACGLFQALLNLWNAAGVTLEVQVQVAESPEDRGALDLI